MENKTNATLLLDTPGSKLVTIDQLAAIPTPEPTKTWTPIAHSTVPEIITQLVEERGWKFTNGGFKIGVTGNGHKMFGVTQVAIPQAGTDEDYGMALGFRNSHDKSIALRIAVGVNVFICSNLMITGDIQVRREHTIKIDARMVVEAAFDMVPQAAANLSQQFGEMRTITMTRDEGIYFLAEAVEVGALPLTDFMEARDSFLGSYKDHTQIEHGGTMWAAYQSVTQVWKHHSFMQIPNYSRNLNELVKIGSGK